MTVLDNRPTGGRGAADCTRTQELQVQVGLLEAVVEGQGKQISQLRQALKILVASMVAGATAEALLDSVDSL